MNFKRIGRTLGCFLLVCCLLFSVTVTRVHATGTGTGTFIGVAIDKAAFYAQAGALGAGASAFCYVLAGLGVIVGVAQAAILLDQYIEWSGDVETSIYYFSDGSWSYGVDMGFVERVREFLFGTGILVQNDGLELDSNFDVPAWVIAEAAAAPYAVLAYEGRVSTGYATSWYVAYSFESPIYAGGSSSQDGDGTVIKTTTSGASIYLMAPSYSEFRKCTTLAVSGNSSHRFYNVQYFGTTLAHIEITTEDAELAEVALPSVSLIDGYPQWAINKQNAILEDETEVEVLPIPFNPSTDIGTLPNGVTQEQVWQGSIADPMPGSDSLTGTFVDTPVGSFLSALGDLLWAPIRWLGEMLLEGIKAIFVPSEDYITAKVEALSANYAFVENMVAAGDTMQVLLGSLEPRIPIIYIDLGATEGSYNIGGKVPFVDLTWYARYKPTVDAIIAAFMWLWFIWRTIVILPGTISGESGLLGSDSVGYFHGYRSSTDRIIYSGPGTSLARRD